MPAPRPRTRFLILAFPLMAIMLAPEAWALADDAAERAKALIDRGRAAEAVPLLEDAAVADPENARVVFLLGVAYQRTGMTGEALIALHHAAVMAPEDGLVRYNLGAVQFALGDYDAAADSFLAVPSRAPGNAPAAYLSAGLARLKAGRTDEARALLERAVEADPKGSAAGTARTVLARLTPVATVSAPAARPRPGAAFYVGREFDSNVFALNDVASTNLSDWRTTARGEVEYRVPLADRYEVTPHYEFYGYWYNSETAYNYRRHRVYLRLDDSRGALRPRLTWGYDFALQGADAFVASHWLDGRLTVHQDANSRIWVRAGVAVEEAPGHQYDYLSGTSWEASLSAYRKGLNDGWLYGVVRLRYRDRGTADVTLAGPNDVQVVYSYTSVEPRLKARTHLPGRLELTGTAGFEVRRYLSDDTWTAPALDAKRRRDWRLNGFASLSRPLWGPLRATLTWFGQVRRSNLGNGVNDYRDRDYERQLYGLFLEGDL